MTFIRKATLEDLETIAEIGRATFFETYLPNTPKEAVHSYVNTAFHEDILRAEFAQDEIHYFLIFKNKLCAGYAKIIRNTAYPSGKSQYYTKLDRLYVLQKYHGKQLGTQLFTHLINYIKSAAQQGIWLYVLMGNTPAIQFYQKHNFVSIGTHDFKVSESHYNPNYVMYLSF